MAPVVTDTTVTCLLTDLLKLNARTPNNKRCNVRTPANNHHIEH